MEALLDVVTAVAMVVAPQLPFIAQYEKMRHEKSAGGFSVMVPLLLLAAHALRLAFWFGKRYSLVLVCQSVVFIVTQLALLYLTLKLRSISHNRKKHEWDLEQQEAPTERQQQRRRRGHGLVGALEAKFDALTRQLEAGDFPLFLGVYCAFLALCCAVGLMVMNVRLLVELLGVLSTVAEALLAVPQIVRNQRTRSVAGVSGLMVAGWFTGDLFKVTYFTTTQAPAQFIVCSVWQLLCDCVLTAQFFRFRTPGKPEALM